MNLFGFALAIAGAVLVALSGGALNGGFVIGGPLAVWGVWLLMKDKKSERSEREEI